MKLHTDSHFVIGHAHSTGGKPCQDHTLSGVLKQHSAAIERAYAVVSDGCSGGRMTDVGARLITTATAKALRMCLPDATEMSQGQYKIVHDVSEVLVSTAAEQLGLSSRDLLATQLVAVVEPSGRCFVSVHGDGAVAFVALDGAITLHTFEWKNNLPFYPHENRGHFIEVQGGIDSPAFSKTTYLINPDGKVETTVENVMSVGAGCEGVTFYTDLDTGLVCLFTDGINQLGRVDPKGEVEKIDPIEVVRRLVAFKGLAGEFVKRRMIRFLKECRDIGVAPIDDLGYAVIAIDHEAE